MTDFQPPVKRVIEGEIVQPITLTISIKGMKNFLAALEKGAEEAREILRKYPVRRVPPWDAKANDRAIDGECSLVTLPAALDKEIAGAGGVGGTL